MTVLNYEITSIVASCYGCARRVVACAQCVTSLKIDSLTGLPLDVARTAEGGYVPKEVDPAALARAAQVIVCDACIDQVNASRPQATRLPTCASRHTDHLRALNAPLN